MNPQSSSELGSKSSASLWLQHKDILRQLYIIENKTLSLVKQIMEDEHQFPTQRLCDYEVALREILKFRKNLTKGEWHAIGIHISNRKRQAKESEVVWNGTRLEAKKVRKDVLRNSRLGQRCIRNSTLELPHGLVIRTPPGSPTPHAKSRLSGGEGDSAHINRPSVFHETIGDVQLACAEARVEVPQFGISPTRKLRENLPFNRFMLRLWNLAQSRPLHMPIPPGQAWTPAPRLFGANPSWDLLGRNVFDLSNGNYQDWKTDENAWFLKWISISADFAMLRAFFSINSPTVGAVYEQLRTIAGDLKRPGLLRLLFELKETLRVNNATSINEAEFVSIAVGIGSRSDEMLEIIKTCASCTPRLTTTKRRIWFMKPSFLVAASRCDIAILQVLVAAGWDIDTTYFDFEGGLIGQIMNRIYSWSPQEENELTAYIDILVRGGILDILSPLGIDDRCPQVAIRDIYSTTWDELLMICPPMKRKTLHNILLRLVGGQGTSISKAGVFTAAQDGVLGLCAYLETCNQADNLLTCVILEESLLCAAILNDLTTASVLLQIGVDPYAGRLSNNLEHYYKGNLPWNPSIVAAAAGSLEVLTLLVSKIHLASFLDSVPIYELVHPVGPDQRSPKVTKRELRRLENLRLAHLYAQTRISQSGVEGSLSGESNIFTQWDSFIVSGRHFDTLQYIRRAANTHGRGQEIDLEIIKAAVLDNDNRPWLQRYNRHLACEVLLMEGLVEARLGYEEGGMDLLHLSIRNHCSLKVARFLLGKGFKVHSRPAAQSRHSMLHDALLSQSPDRLDIVELLLLGGADCNICGEGLTILEASLWTIPPDSDDRSQNLEIFKRLFKAGAPVYHWPRQQLPEWKPLVVLLLRAGADDDLVLQVVDAGADLNAAGYTNNNQLGDVMWNLTPLQACLGHGRERLARELIRRGADVHAPAFQQYGRTALQTACESGVSIPLLEYLVTVLGVRVDEPPAKIGGLTSLGAAASRGSLNAVEFLIDHGADVNAMSDYHTPYIFDGGHGKYRPVRPLDHAVYTGKLDTVEFLLKAGGRSSTDGLGGAIIIAKRRRHFAILSVLRSWDEKYGHRILEEEALWQRRNPEEALMLSE